MMTPQRVMQLSPWFCPIVVAATAAMMAGCLDGKAMVPTATSEHARPPSATPHVPASAVRVEMDRLAKREGRQPAGAEIGNAFNPTSWYVPPPPPAPVNAEQQEPPKPPKPPKPTAPPVPFTYFGRYADSTMQVVMLLKGDQIYTVSEGDTIDSSYRVDRVAAGVVELTYLPLNIKQSVITGDAS